MKTSNLVLTILFVVFFYSQSMAQPFNLDPKIKPTELMLLDSNEKDGEKGLATMGKVSDEAVYYFVKGHDVFQLIDVYIFSYTGNEEFTVQLVKDSWDDSIDKKVSTQQKNGVINFKLRTWGDFGFKILPVKKKMGYAVIVTASPPVKKYLDSPFFKAPKTNTDSDTPKVSPDKKETSQNIETPKQHGSNLWSNILIGTFLLAMGFLASKGLRNKRSISILLFSIFLGSSSLLSAQPTRTQNWTLEEIKDGTFASDMESARREDFEELQNRRSGAQELGDVATSSKAALDKFESIRKDIVNKKDIGKSAIDFYNSYKGLSSCINSVPLPDAPRLPSFCTTDECDSCFRDARQKFNFTRYQFEKLSAIYNCTIDYSKKAVSLGDNASGLHAVSGLAWQIQRRNIEKSVDELKAAYDNRYQLLVTDLQESMQKLNSCEAAHGLPDWYDRFGYMYYDFMKLKYQRDK